MAEGNILSYVGSNLVFPISKQTLKEEAISNNADQNILDGIDQIKSDEFHSYNDIENEFATS